MKRLSLFLFYDPDGIVDDYIPYFLNDLKKNCDEIVVVVNEYLTIESKTKLENCSDKIFIRKNIGFDVWAYKEVMEFLGYDYIRKFDECILLNYTNFGPLYPFREMFDKMDKRTDIDFWGITKSLGDKVCSTDDSGKIPPHIQSHFTVIRNKMLNSAEFKKYWDSVPRINSFEDALFKHEFVFTKHFADLGYKWDVYLDYSEFEHNLSNPMLSFAIEPIRKQRCPILKRKVFFEKPDYLELMNLRKYNCDLIQFIKNNTDYDINLIIENILRTQNLKTIHDNIELSKAVSPTLLKNKNSTSLKSAILLNIFNEENYDFIMEYLQNIPANIDIIFLTENIDEIKDRFKYLKNNLIYVLKDKSYPSHLSYPIIYQYDVVCYLDNKRANSWHSDTFSIFNKPQYDNIIASEIFIKNILNIFEKNPKLGLLIPGINRFKNNVLNLDFKLNYKDYKNTLINLGIKVNTDKNISPLDYYIAYYWFRPDCLKKIKDAKFKKENYYKWTLPYAAQDSGYYSEYLYNEEYIQLELSYCQHYLTNIKNNFYNGIGKNKIYTNIIKLFGLPLIDIDVYYHKRNFKLFGLIPIFKIRLTENSNCYYLLNFILILKTKIEKDIKKYYLLGFIPTFTIYEN